MKTLSIILISLSAFVVAVVNADVKPAEKKAAASAHQKTTVRGGYYHYDPPKPKYCYKTICKDYHDCKYEECHCSKLEYVCDCNKYASYYFKEYSSGHGRSYGHGPEFNFVLKKVCLDYKLCDYSKCEKCKKCDKVTKCFNEKYICGYYH